MKHYLPVLAALIGYSKTQSTPCTQSLTVNVYQDEGCMYNHPNMTTLYQNAYQGYKFDECTPYYPTKSYNYQCSDDAFITSFYPNNECNPEGVDEVRYSWDTCTQDGNYWIKIDKPKQKDNEELFLEN